MPALTVANHFRPSALCLVSRARCRTAVIVSEKLGVRAKT